MARETTTGGRTFRECDEVFVAGWCRPCKIYMVMDESEVMVFCPGKPMGEPYMEVSLDNVWHTDDEGRREWLAHRLEN